MDVPRVAWQFARHVGASVRRTPSLPQPNPRFARQPCVYRCTHDLTWRPISTTAHTQNPATATAEKETESLEESAAPQPRQPPSSQSDSTTTGRDIPEDQRRSVDQLDKMLKALPRQPQYDARRPPPRIPGVPTAGEIGRQYAANEQAQIRGQPQSGRDLDISRMIIPGSGSTQTFNNPFDPGMQRMESYISPTVVVPDTAAPPFRMGPSLGRTVRVDTRDLASAFRSLDIQCARNRVRADFNKQRFHERPGLKRKRLHSERWRRRFKADFQAVCRRVEELRRKGW